MTRPGHGEVWDCSWIFSTFKTPPSRTDDVLVRYCVVLSSDMLFTVLYIELLT